MHTWYCVPSKTSLYNDFLPIKHYYDSFECYHEGSTNYSDLQSKANRRYQFNFFTSGFNQVKLYKHIYVLIFGKFNL